MMNEPAFYSELEEIVAKCMEESPFGNDEILGRLVMLYETDRSTAAMFIKAIWDLSKIFNSPSFLLRNLKHSFTDVDAEELLSLLLSWKQSKEHKLSMCVLHSERFSLQWDSSGVVKISPCEDSEPLETSENKGARNDNSRFGDSGHNYWR